MVRLRRSERPSAPPDRDCLGSVIRPLTAGRRCEPRVLRVGFLLKTKAGEFLEMLDTAEARPSRYQLLNRSRPAPIRPSQVLGRSAMKEMHVQIQDFARFLPQFVQKQGAAQARRRTCLSLPAAVPYAIRRGRSPP